jgi:hypothetical protein
MALSVFSTSASAQAGNPAFLSVRERPNDPEAFRMATEQGACEDTGVEKASFNAQQVIEVICRDAGAVIPLGGGLSPAAGLGAALAIGAIAAAAGGSGGGATNNTQ